MCHSLTQTTHATAILYATLNTHRDLTASCSDTKPWLTSYWRCASCCAPCPCTSPGAARSERPPGGADNWGTRTQSFSWSGPVPARPRQACPPELGMFSTLHLSPQPPGICALRKAHKHSTPAPRNSSQSCSRNRLRAVWPTVVIVSPLPRCKT